MGQSKSFRAKEYLVGKVIKSIVENGKEKFDDYEENGLFSEFPDVLRRELNKNLKPQKRFTKDMVINYLYGRTPWPEMERDTAVLVVCKALKECLDGCRDPETDLKREFKKYIEDAKGLLCDTYTAYEQHVSLEKKIAELVPVAQSVFLSLDDPLAHIMHGHIDAIISLTSDDLQYMTYVRGLGITEQLKQTERLKNSVIRCHAEQLYNLVDNSEVDSWTRMKNLSLQKYKRSSWENSIEKWKPICKRLTGRGIEGAVSFITVAYWCTERYQEGKLPFTENEIKLLLLFKYCISDEMKSLVLSEIR